MEENIEKKPSVKVNKNVIIFICIVVVVICCAVVAFILLNDDEKENKDVTTTTTTTELANVEVDEEKIVEYLNTLFDYKIKENYEVKSLSNSDKLKLVSSFINYNEIDTLDKFNDKVKTLIDEEVIPEDIIDTICLEVYYLYDKETKTFKMNPEHLGHGGYDFTYRNSIKDIKVEGDIITVVAKTIILDDIPYSRALTIDNKEIYKTSYKEANIILDIVPGAGDEVFFIGDNAVKQIFDEYDEKINPHTYVFKKVNDNYLLISHSV